MLLVEGKIENGVVLIGEKHQRKMGEMDEIGNVCLGMSEEKDEWRMRMCGDEDYVSRMCEWKKL